MSKVDAMRALREARAAAASKAAPAKKAPVKVAPAKAAPAKVAPVEAAAAESQALCGHRSMNGRSCTRDLGHAEKNHRYG